MSDVDRWAADHDWPLPPLRDNAPGDLSTYGCELALSSWDQNTKRATWSVADGTEAPPTGTISVIVTPHGSSWRGTIEWEGSVGERLVRRAVWCVERWLRESRVEETFFRADLPHAAEVAEGIGLAVAARVDADAGYLGSTLQTGRGYLFLSQADDELAHDGLISRDPERGWLVVDSVLTKVGTSRWPGRLFEVEIVAPGSMAERLEQLEVNAGFRATATHTRAAAVRIIDEISPARLFGDHGDGVMRVIRVAERLDPGDARQLADARSSEADRLYGAAISRWAGDGADHSRTIHLPSRGGSPIHDGLLLINEIVGGRTSDRILDEDGDAMLPEPWSSARSAMLDAALALGAPRWLEPEERDTLLSPFLGIEARKTSI